MDHTYATTLAYLAFGVLVLLLAAFMLRKELKNAGGAISYLCIGVIAAVNIVLPVHHFGVRGVVDTTAALQHTAPLVGWLLLGGLAIGIAVPMPCFAHAYKLARTAIAEHNLRARISMRLSQLRRDVRNSH